MQYVPKGADAAADTAAIEAAKAKAATEASGLQAINLANLATESRPSMQRVTDEEMASYIGEIQAYDATDRQKIDQVIGYMNEQAVSPYRLSTVTNTPLSNIQTAMNPYYNTNPEIAAATPTADTDIHTYLKQLILGSQPTPYATGMAKGGIAGYAGGGQPSAAEIGKYQSAYIVYQLKLKNARTPEERAEIEAYWQEHLMQYNPAVITAAQQQYGGGNAPSQVSQPQRQSIGLDKYLRPLSGQRGYADGGIASLATQGRYFGGPTDGMGDVIPATIDRQEPAMLSDGEFVIPADVVSHFGNGNSDAGAEQLFGMMDRVRRARTGTPSQGREINPMQYTLA